MPLFPLLLSLLFPVPELAVAEIQEKDEDGKCHNGANDNSGKDASIGGVSVVTIFALGGAVAVDSAALKLAVLVDAVIAHSIFIAILLLSSQIVPFNSYSITHKDSGSGSVPAYCGAGCWEDSCRWAGSLDWEGCIPGCIPGYIPGCSCCSC